MPKRVPWLEYAMKVDALVANQFLDGIQSYDISYAKLCRNHYALSCSQDALPDANVEKCSCREKAPTFLETNIKSVYDFGFHTTDTMPPHKSVFDEEGVRSGDAYHLYWSRSLKKVRYPSRVLANPQHRIELRQFFILANTWRAVTA
ncbi:LOW QUALITY PROTEIN: hypothetical protein PHMEG_00014372 [Phytophthora megakarya]|uniref:Uncharacterized protein n=1 Tax=Phytophthora megakarya TaxID=4795 RepID=A0A225W3Y2_9STRA|nr:LOW QUALITY PROTEIN: hypothetical protein PHMEG_00014372 [Phytophthora megakarya]